MLSQKSSLFNRQSPDFILARNVTPVDFTQYIRLFLIHIDFKDFDVFLF